MTKTGKVVIAVGLLAYGLVSLLAIYIASMEGGPDVECLKWQFRHLGR
jgi:hypothetical protein